MRILIAEDDQVLADGLLRSLRASGAAVDHVASGTEADAALMTNNEFDLLILDLGLPKMHGLEVLRKLRARGSSMPVLILTAADAIEERVKGLDLGADDYMAKPFALSELEARVRALTRRGMGATSSTIKHGPLVYDQAGRVATIDGKMVELSARELGLLEVLLQRAGRLVSKDQLVERLCEWGEEVSNNAIEVYIHRLRKKIEKGPIRMPRCGAGISVWRNFTRAVRPVGWGASRMGERARSAEPHACRARWGSLPLTPAYEQRPEPTNPPLACEDTDA